MRFAPLALLLGALTSCTSFSDTVAIHFSSDPPGADVLVDGVPTGMATPCMIALDKKQQAITLRKPGFTPALRMVQPDPFNDTWYWSEATVGPHTADFALWINLDDAITPVKRTNELIPGRIFVRLKRLADQ
jgi:hypothetical protein